MNAETKKTGEAKNSRLIKNAPRGKNAKQKNLAEIGSQIIEENRSRHLPLLLRLCRRVCVFLFLTLIAFLIFYISGNYQNFLDSNISLILRSITCVSIALAIFSTACILETFFFAFKAKRFPILFNLIFFVLTLILSVAACILSLVINKLSEGIVF